MMNRFALAIPFLLFCLPLPVLSQTAVTRRYSDERYRCRRPPSILSKNSNFSCTWGQETAST